MLTAIDLNILLQICESTVNTYAMQTQLSNYAMQTQHYTIVMQFNAPKSNSWIVTKLAREHSTFLADIQMINNSTSLRIV